MSDKERYLAIKKSLDVIADRVQFYSMGVIAGALLLIIGIYFMVTSYHLWNLIASIVSILLIIGFGVPLYKSFKRANELKNELKKFEVSVKIT